MRAKLIVGSLSAVAAIGFSAAGAHGGSWMAVDSPILIIHKQIGDMRMGETEAEVGYDYGGDCQSGCEGVSTGGCVLGITKCEGPIYRYRVRDGYLDVGYIQHRVVYLETNSPHYRTTTGIRVGFRIPFGQRAGIDWSVGLHTFRHSCASIMFRRGVPTEAIRRILGHHSWEFTAGTYVHLSDGDLPDGAVVGDLVGAPSASELGRGQPVLSPRYVPPAPVRPNLLDLQAHFSDTAIS